jgi:hypothetical protein
MLGRGAKASRIPGPDLNAFLRLRARARCGHVRHARKLVEAVARRHRAVFNTAVTYD